MSKRSNVGLGIKSTAGRKTFVEEWNGHNAFAHLLKFDELRQYDVIMMWCSIEEDTERYHQNFLLCNNNEITTCNADLFNSFCEEVYVVAFFKIMQ